MRDCWGEDYFNVCRCCEGGEGGCEVGIGVVRGQIEQSVDERIPRGADEKEGFGG